MRQEANEILKLRLASGEISIEEYRKLVAEISVNVHSANSLANSEDTQGKRGGANKLLAEFEDMKVYETHIIYKGCEHALREISSVSGGQSSRSFNFVPTEKLSGLNISFLSGTTITLSENRVLFGGKRHEAIGKLLALLRNMTFQTRLTNLVTKLLKNGQVELHKPIFGSGEVIGLSKEGLVITPSRSIDLKQAKASGTFALGSERRSLNMLSYEINPSEVIISEKRATFGMMIPRGALRFVPFVEDVDITHALLTWMAEPGNKLIRNPPTT